MKRFLIPLLAALALPNAVNANIDPKVAEICMKATDFQGCVKSMSGQKNNNLSIKSGYDSALIAFEKGDTLKAMKLINSYIKKNPNSKEGFLLRAFINTYDLSEFDKALEDIDQALEIDQNYALAYALKSDVFYFDIGGSASQTKKMLKKAFELSPNNPFVNFVKGDFYYDNSFVLLDKDKKDLAIKSAEEALIHFEKVVVNSQNNNDLIFKRVYPLGISYTATALLGDTKFELYFMYKDIKDRKKAKKYLEESLVHYTEAISMAPSQEKAEEIELDRDFDLRTPADVYRARGNVYSWMNNKVKKACSDWKVAKGYGDKDAQKNYREFRC
tara:strand:- start:165 stop:1154 length:990 start_codon:yes stop_codon:yes gene_type:complete